MSHSEREFIPFAVPMIGDEEITEVVASLRSGWLSTGPKTKAFEEAVAEYVGAAWAVAVGSCTAGLHLSLVAMGIGPGDEVIVPSMTFCSTANVVEHVGARPVLVDVDDDYNIDLRWVERLMTPRTKAIMPVHFAGQAVDLDPLYRLAAAHELAVIEDAAHAIGSSYGTARVGSDELIRSYPGLRRTTVYSFYATKNMTTGEGGMVVTNDELLAGDVRTLSLHGMTKDAWKRYSEAGSWYYEVVAPGFKANLTDIQAAIGLHQLSRLDDFRAERRRQAEFYDRGLGPIPEIVLPPRREGRDHGFHLYVIGLLADDLGIDRNRFIELLRSKQIGTSVHFIPVHLHPFYSKSYGFSPADLPVASSLYERSISIPIYPGLSREDQGYVVKTIREIVEDSRRC